MKTNVINVELGEIRNNCFVVMPFDPLFDTEYERVIKLAVEEVELECIRADQIFEKPRVMDDIWKSIRSSRVIVAELTGRNPNVLYEVGLAHAIGKPIIIITRNEEDVPFDLRAMRYLFYDTNDPDWGNNLKTGLFNLLKVVIANTEEMGKYLEGITSSGSIELPALKVVQHEAVVSKNIFRDVAGFWQGKFGRTNQVGLQGMLSIVQDGSNLSASMTITFQPASVSTNITRVVQETFTGYIKGDKVHLTGVNRSYLVREQAKETYLLDAFELTLSDNGENLAGDLIENKVSTGKASFDKSVGLLGS